MLDSGESRKEVIRPDFNRAIMIDFQGVKITSDVGFLLMRVYSAKEAPKPRWDRNSYACGIISDNNNQN